MAPGRSAFDEAKRLHRLAGTFFGKANSRYLKEDSTAGRCVLLADRHHGLTEGIRGLLESEFPAVVMVADETSLLATASTMHPTLVVADVALGRGEGFGWLKRLLRQFPAARVIVLSPHDEASVMQAAFDSGAWGYVRRREIASELLIAVTEVLSGRRYSPDAAPGRRP